MANTLTVFNATVIANEALRQLRTATPLAKRIRRDYSNAVKTYGDRVDIPKFGALVANDKTNSTNVTKQDVSSTKVTGILNKHKEVTFLIYDPERAFAGDSTDLIAGYTASGVKAIAEAVEADIFALYAGLSQQIGTAGTAITEAQVLLLRKKLTDMRAPLTDRSLIVSTKDYNALLAIDRFTAADKIGVAGRIAEGAVGRIHGFDVFESVFAPVVAGTPDATHGIAMHQDALALVVRDLPAIPDGMGSVGKVLSDPESGLSLRVRMSYNADAGAIQVTVEILYGVFEVRDEIAIDVLT